ncbi:MAG: hypothetical protein P4K86_10355 [Terracidiphilus sp.]|jgi:hypothetical protein|uniref:DNA-binding protein n=1 Tax=Telmatobacter bradus TaxID=474953 RepID=UPI002845F689|nr:hypothetical protein [Terracidiphilus sp.]
MLSTAEILIAKYGPLMTLAQLAATLERSIEGLRFGLRSDNDFSNRVNAARVRLGRRVYFHTVKIASVLDCQ